MELDDEEYDDDYELPSIAEGNAYMDASMFPEAANAYGPDAVPIADAAKGASEGQELRGATGKKQLSAQEMKQGAVMLEHIRDKLAASTSTVASTRSRQHSSRAT